MSQYATRTTTKKTTKVSELNSIADFVYQTLSLAENGNLWSTARTKDQSHSAARSHCMSWNIRLICIVTALLALTSAKYSVAAAENDLGSIKTEVTKRHDEAIKRLQ